MNHDLTDDTPDLLNEAFRRVTYHRELASIVPQELSRRRKATLIITATVAVAALATGGIAAARRGLPDAVSYATDVRSTEQAQALVDDEVTLAEYKAGFQRFADCMQRDGRPLADVTFNSTTQLFAYTYDGVDDCYDREFYAVDFSWQASDIRPRDPAHPDISNEQLRRACATGGPAPTGLPQEFFEQTCALLNANPTVTS